MTHSTADLAFAFALHQTAAQIRRREAMRDGPEGDFDASEDVKDAWAASHPIELYFDRALMELTGMADLIKART